MQVRRNHHGKETLVEEGEEVGSNQAADHTGSLVSKSCALLREVLERKMGSLRDCGGSFFCGGYGVIQSEAEVLSLSIGARSGGEIEERSLVGAAKSAAPPSG
jgi:hypothetical protein